MTSPIHPAFGAVLLIVLVAVAAAAIATRPSREQREKLKPFSGPAVAIEFAGDSKDVARVYEAMGPAEVRKGLRFDDRWIIPVYTVLLSAVFALIFLHLPPGVSLPLRLAGLALGVCLVGATAWYDGWRENPAIDRVIDKTAGPGDAKLPPEVVAARDIKPELDGLRVAALWKWSLAFAAFAVAGLMVATGGGRFGLIIAAAYLISAAVGYAGLFTEHKSLLDLAFNKLMGVPLILTAIWLMRS